jgi:hypothetical protein
LKYYIGIDCGLDGGITMINWKGKLMQTSVMPTVPSGKGRKIDLCGLAAMIKEIGRHPEQYTFIVENPGAHAPSAAGLRSMTYSFAAVETLLAAYQLKHHVVLSQKWQKAFWSKPKMPKGQKFNTKAAALNVAKQIFPAETWLKSERCTKPHDGMIDAALLAEYGRRENI